MILAKLFDAWRSHLCLLKVWPYPIKEEFFFIVDSYVSFPKFDEISVAFHIDLQAHDMKAVTLIPQQSSMHSENN